MKDLTAEQQQQVRGVLLEYADVFVGDDGVLGRTSMARHSIDTGDTLPVKQSPRRMPPAIWLIATDEVDKMLRQGIIEPSNSPWSSLIVLVDKKDGTYRCCVDFRKLNEATRKDTYPLPRTNDLLDELAGNKWFSTLDLASGYWQVEMDPIDKEKTAFTLQGKGLFHFSVMSFILA